VESDIPVCEDTDRGGRELKITSVACVPTGNLIDDISVFEEKDQGECVLFRSVRTQTEVEVTFRSVRTQTGDGVSLNL
jgi:hypothetical protein